VAAVQGRPDGHTAFVESDPSLFDGGLEHGACEVEIEVRLHHRPILGTRPLWHRHREGAATAASSAAVQNPGTGSSQAPDAYTASRSQAATSLRSTTSKHAVGPAARSATSPSLPPRGSSVVSTTTRPAPRPR